MRPLLLAWLLAAGLAPRWANAQAPASAGATTTRPAAASLGLSVGEHRLKNGMRVLLLENHTVPSMSLWTFYHVGSRNERPGITGISHLFEHMMFNGAKKYGPKEFDRVLESNGGYSNAFTDKDITAYYETFPSTALERVLDLEADRMRDLDLSQQTLDSEREVVKEERRLRVDNSIPGRLGELLNATAFLAHSYQWPVIGWMADLDSISREDCRQYFRTYYAPNNCTTVLVGDFDSRDALALCERYLGGLPAGPPLPEVAINEPPQRGERRAELRYPAQTESFYAGWHIPAVGHADLPALEILSTLLATGESSRLHRRLVYGDRTALSVSAGYRPRVHPGLFTLYVEMQPGKGSSVGEKAAYEEIERVAREGVTERELAKAKNLVRASFVRSLKTNEGRAEEVGTYDFWYGDPGAMERVLAGLLAVTVDDVKRVAGAYFAPAGRTVAFLVPEAEPADKEPAR